MFSRISNKIPRFHKSHNSRPKLLNIQEFYYLEKPIRKQYVRGLFHKHQAGARRISQEIHQKQTSEPQSSIYSVEPSTYSEVDPTDSNNHSQHPQTESHSVRNDIIVSEERDYDIISKEMKKKTSQDSSNDLKSPTFFNPYFNTFVTIPTSPLVIDNRKLFYMDTKDKEEDHIKLSTREKISSGEDCLTRTERIWQEIDDILEDEGRCDEIPTDGKYNKYKLDSTITRSHLEPFKINRGNEITNMARVSSRVDSLDCENFEVDLRSSTAATITAPTPSATTATTRRTAATVPTSPVVIDNRKLFYMDTKDKEEDHIKLSTREKISSGEDCLTRTELPTDNSQNERIFPCNPFSPCKRPIIKPVNYRVAYVYIKHVNHKEPYAKYYRPASDFAQIKWSSPF
ncbi:uncharacterized protein J8A68_001634 [[Candida] subhashii]|uniref:Uncharacterized protein n=1 Tax=[Candida] subhashii TaxID=561895 RepID=A0A8J5URP6_9ASCO|nr:uncharacterized protein J8A68_001634 [[Candida] subhashii]KAG7664817.1 hypothetical protein J8A68_001634 [[Candida] subhashii]